MSTQFVLLFLFSGKPSSHPELLSSTEAFTCRRFHDEKTGLYLYGDLYIIDELEIELLGAEGDYELRDVLFQALSLDELKIEVEKFGRFLRGGISFLDHQPASVQGA